MTWTLGEDEIEPCQDLSEEEREQNPYADFLNNIEAGHFYKVTKSFGYDYEEVDVEVDWDKFDAALIELFGIANEEAARRLSVEISDLLDSLHRDQYDTLHFILDIFGLAKDAFGDFQPPLGEGQEEKDHV